MASSVVSLILQGKDEASAVFDRVGGKLGGLKGAALGLGAAAVGALVGVGAAAFNMATQVDGAADTIQTQLGATRDEAEALADVATNVFANNFGDSMEDAAAGIITVRQQMDRLGQMGADELGQVTEAAFALRDAFDIDLSESTNAAAVLMNQFGLSSEEAMDFIAAGMQRGLNSSGDFLDSISEYGNLFGQAGFDAGQFFSIMETGMQGGVLGTDKIADAFKEAGIKIQELSDDMLESLDIIGVDSSAMFQGLQDGSMTTADALNEILPAIMALESPIERNAMGVKIFGTMWEDLGTNAFAALDMQKTAMADLQGSTATLNAQYDNMSSMAEGFGRRASVALIPLGDKILEIVNSHMPQIEAAFAWFEQTAPVLVQGLIDAIDWLIPVLQNAWVVAEQLGVIVVFALDRSSTAARQLGAIVVIEAQKILNWWNRLKTTVQQLGTIISTSFSNAWNAARNAVDAAWSKISPIVDAIKNFASWLSGKVFKFNFEFPKLPDWATPGSPIPLHTRWKDFGDYLDRQTFAPQVDLSGAAGLQPGALVGTAGTPAAAGRGGGPVYQFGPGSIVIKDETTGKALLAWLQGVQDRDALGAFA